MSPKSLFVAAIRRTLVESVRVLPKPFKFTFLQDSQKLWLKLEWNVSDLVQE